MPISSSAISEAESKVDSRDLYVNAPKKFCNNHSLLRNNEIQRGALLSKQMEILYKLGNDFPWLEYNEDYRGAFCKVCRRSGKSLQQTGGVSVTKLFTNWKK